MDEQHKKLIAMINRLHGALKKGHARMEIRTILEELTAYTVEHFTAEEAFMAGTNYPDLERHKEIHRQFVAKVVDAKQRWQAGDEKVIHEVLRLLKEWLPQHILVTDKEYGPDR